jgi:hypothetical protein
MFPPRAHLPRRTFLTGLAGTAAAVAAGSLAACSPGSVRPAPTASPAADDTGDAPIQVSHDAFTVHAEPSIAVSPRDPRNLLGCCMAQSGTAQSIATYVSFDAGATWASNGALPSHPAYYFVNATVAFDPRGRGYVSSVAGTTPDTQDVGVLVWRTTDGGRSFQSPVAALTGLADHPWLATSPGRPMAPAPLHVVSYGTSGLAYTRSADGAASFEPARTLVPQPLVGWPMITTGPRGAVHVAYVGQAGPGGARSPLPLWVISSYDYGTTFSAPVEVTRQTPQLPPRPGGPAWGKSNPVIAASPRDGSLYLASVRYQVGSGHTDIMISSSPDQGRTWNTPVPATPADDVIYFSPKLAIDGTGRLGVFTYGLGPGGISAYLIVSQPHRLRFSPPARLARPFSPAVGVDRGGMHWLGDYQGLTASGTTFHPFWSGGQSGQMEIYTAAAREKTAT